MPKHTTLQIQDKLVKLGKTLGFDAQMEVALPVHKGTMAEKSYRPIYDVVWFYPSSTLTSELLSNLSTLIDQPLDRAHLPFALFEIEGSTTSSKNQVGNFINLYHTTAPLKCMITNNGEAGSENDTYRRGHKIVRSLAKQFGMRNLLFFDAEQLEATLDQGYSVTQFVTEGSGLSEKKGHGGEKAKTRAFLRSLLQPFVGKMIIGEDDRLPESSLRLLGCDLYKESILGIEDQALKKKETVLGASLGLMAKKYPSSENLESTRSRPLYIPKLDGELGFYLREGVIHWLQKLKLKLGYERGQYPLLHGLPTDPETQLFLSLVGIEIEESDSKHALGGLANLKMNSQVGLVIAPSNVEPKLRFMMESLGTSNIYFKLK